MNRVAICAVTLFRLFPPEHLVCVNLIRESRTVPANFFRRRYLLSRGADPFVRDAEQNIALHWSAIAGSVDITDALLNYNSDINCTNVHGDTPL